MAKDTKYIRKRKRKYGTAFLIEIPYKDEEGTQKRYTATVKVLDYGDEKTALIAAQRIRNEALNDIQSGKLKRSFPTIKSLYRQKWELMPLSINTHEKQDAIYSTAIRPIESKYIDEVTVSDIQLSVNQYALDHSQDAVSRLMTVWRQIFKCALILGYDVPDRTEAVIIPKSKIVTQHRDVRMNVDDFLIVLDALKDSGRYNDRVIYYMLLIMYYTGCRPAEALALTADDISDMYIRINKAVGSTASLKRQIVPTKTESSVRRLPIASELIPVLDDLKEWSKHKHLLAFESGELADIDEVSDTINKIAKKKHVHFNAYMLRHLMSSELLHKGDSVIARDLLGHTSFSMTLDYARSTDQQILEAVAGRSLAESQPKNKSHESPPVTMIRIYQIFKLCAVMRFCAYLKAFPESMEIPMQSD
jgi:integrase